MRSLPARAHSLMTMNTEIDAKSATEESLRRIAAHEETLHAWAHLDEGLARKNAELSRPGPLAGMTVGVKDIFNTADQLTEYGSPIYVGHQPFADAAAVALLRAAGAVIIGKTVTAELAWSTPGATTNPHRPTHTPGGSSSGSAAAVAARTIDVALGTQTAGSVIRPASFCGVFGLKPTFGLIPTAGVKPGAPSLDTVGILSCDIDVLARAQAVLSRRPLQSERRPLTFGFQRTEMWEDADEDSRAAVELAASLLDAVTLSLPNSLSGLADDSQLIQNYEGTLSLAWERLTHNDQLSDGLRERLESGDATSPEDYEALCRRVQAAKADAVIERLFGGVDVLVTPAVVGEAPAGLASTGDPRFCRLWTTLGLPALSVPGLVGASGLPIGVQLIARPYAEGMLLEAGRALAALLNDVDEQ